MNRLATLEYWIRRVRHWLGPSDRADTGAIFREHAEAYQRCRMLIPFFYVILVSSMMQAFPWWEVYLSRTQWTLLWPVYWLAWIPLSGGILAILIFSLMSAFAASVFSGSRLVRAAAFLGIFQFAALSNSTGKIGHNLHVMVFISFLLIWLPDGWNRSGAPRWVRSSVYLIVSGAQAVLMLSYTMAGLIKVGAGVFQLAAGQSSVFHYDGLARQIADRLLQTGASRPLGEWLITNPVAAWPLMMLVLYVELFAIWAVFRPRLQVFFAVALIVFHAGSYFTMTILFLNHCVLLGLLLAIVPLGSLRWSARGFVRDLPVIGAVFGRLERKRLA
ncbi:MAG: hypothetical protein ACAH89_11355 [Rariglobus sp.]|nr:hypothetical protein [Rariglobus sp.]